MFDANAGHIKCGDEFFAEVHSMSEQLRDMGIRRGDIVLCKHNEKAGHRMRENVESTIWTVVDGARVEHTYRPKEDDSMSWLVYSGRPNGIGFISDEWKSKALEFLGGEWVTPTPLCVVYENATKNDEPLHKLLEFEPRAEKVVYDGEEYVNVWRVSLKVKRGGKVKATSHPTSITNMPSAKGLRK